MQRKNFLFIAFFLSGISAIIYEILWLRLLSLSFGGVVLVAASVASLFLLGLCVGSLIMGKVADLIAGRALRSLFYAYFIIELGVSLLGLINFGTFISFSLHANQMRYFVTVILILLQTILMGATWPLMFTIALNLEGKWNIAGKIVFLNTFGGFLGAILSNFFLISNFGLKETLFVAMTINVFSSLLVFSFAKSITFAQRIESKKPLLNKITKDKVLIFLSLFLAGFCGMGLEILWMRVFGLLFGSSVYSFSLVLAVILLSLAIGGLFVGIGSKSNFSFSGLIRIILLELFSVLIGMIMIARYPYLLASLNISDIDLLSKYNFIQFMLVALVVFIPALASGAVLPYAIRLLKGDDKDSGSVSGFSYFINTIGSVAGGFLSAVVIMPLLGIKIGIIAIGGLMLIVPVFWLFFQGKVKILFYVLLATVLLEFCAFKVWEDKVIASGVYYYGDRVFKETGWKTDYYKDGIESTVTVTNYRGVNSLRINGKVDASAEGDMSTQVILGSVPLLLHQNPKNVLVIGAGSGVTAGVVNEYPLVQKLKIAEIEPQVAYVANKYFSGVNHSVFDSPKANLVVNDARNYLLETHDKFDVITSEPSNPWIAGEGNLFTKEFFEIGKSRLNERGVFFQWLHIYNLRQTEIKSILATFNSVFPNVLIFEGADPSDIFFAGSTEEFRIDWKKFQTVPVTGDFGKSLKENGFEDGLKVLSLLCTSEKKLSHFDSEINSDKKPILEYRAPYALRTNTLLDNYRFLRSICLKPDDFLTNFKTPREYQMLIKPSLEARGEFMEAKINFESGNEDGAIKNIVSALEVDDKAPSVKQFASQLYAQKALNMINNNFNAESGSIAEKYLKDAIKLYPKNYDGVVYLIYLDFSQGKIDEAEKIVSENEQVFPWSGAIVMYKGLIAGKKGDFMKEEELLLKALSMEGWNFVIMNRLGDHFLAGGNRNEALNMWNKSLKQNPNQSDIIQKVRANSK